jgi:putative peptidoglycan lipid II flippase
VLGLAREVMITSLFGATGEVSAFRLASQVPVLIYDFLIGGMLSAALVPVLSQHFQQRSRAEFGKLIGILAATLGLLMLILVVLLELLAPQITWLLAGGFNKTDPALLELTTHLLRLSLPAVWFMCMAGLTTATLFALGRFSFPALAAGAYNLGIICVAPLLAQRYGIVSLVIGMLVGTIAQFGVLLYDFRRAGVPIELRIHWQHPVLGQIVRLYVPIAAGIVVSLLQIGLDRRLATGTQPESVAWMSNATTLQQLPLGLISVAISLAALPRLSQFFVSGDEQSYRSTLGLGIRMVLLLIVPAAMILWTLGEPIIRILFERNRFTPADTTQVAAALDIYVLGMLFAAIDYPLNFAFYARQNTQLPALVGVISVGFYCAVAFALLEPLGYLGLVWADTAKQIGHMLIMVGLVSWQVSMGRELFGKGTLWILLAGIGAGGVMWALSALLDPSIAPGFGHDLLLLVVAGGGGLLFYWLLLHWVRLPELATVNAWFWARIRRAKEP